MTVAKTRKTVTAKTDASKKAPVAKKAPSIKEPLTKSQILTHISETTSLSKKQVALVLDELTVLIHASVKIKGPGAFTLPGILKINVIKKAAKKARKGINPFTGEETIFKAKPAHHAVKIRPLKKLKEMTQ